MGLYTGFNLHLLRDTLGTAIYFAVYESSKQLVTSLGGEYPYTRKLAVLMSGGSVVSFLGRRYIPSTLQRAFTKRIRSYTQRAKSRATSKDRMVQAPYVSWPRGVYGPLLCR
ncbi:unnamed protein product [Parascedosporium putredinis]|uniref:Uncharacterized protein n=1 Tax=Parascedosporium putredinis TaxID=1442378 RepID=A0A9P1H9X7_9PEZI|nr:unnamed protein product [Parascedosporium putredinis]CAI8001286.1 unnamed protein product [Parascedosporium putredinis]